MTSSAETFQLSIEAAEAYEAGFVPALFADWAPALVDAAGVRPGQRVLDVACGTGVVAREAADRLRGEGRTVGLDLNEARTSCSRCVSDESRGSASAGEVDRGSAALLVDAIWLVLRRRVKAAYDENTMKVVSTPQPFDRSVTRIRNARVLLSQEGVIGCDAHQLPWPSRAF